MAIGEAFITVRADVSGFRSELEAQLRPIIAQAQASVAVTPTGTGSTAADLAASNARKAIADAERRAYIEDANLTTAARKAALAQQVADAKAAATAIQNVNRITADNLNADLNDQKAAARVAASAIADAETGEAAAAKKATDGTIDLGAALSSLKIPALVGAAALAAVAAAAAGLASIVAVEGVRGADAIRSLTLQLEAAGASAGQALAEVQALQALASNGLSLTGLAADAKALTDLGLSIEQTTKLLTGLANAGAGEGLVGANLDAFIASATQALAAATSAGKATTTTIGSISSALGVSQTAIREQLGLTSAALDAQIKKGTLSGAAIANAGVAAVAALKTSQAGLADALANSPTQALDSLKSRIGDVLSSAFSASNPGIAQGISGIGDKLIAELQKVAPQIAADTTSVLNGLSEAIGPISHALEDTLSNIAGFLKEAVDPASTVHEYLVDLGKDGTDIGAVLLPILKGLAGGFGAIAETLRPVLDLLGAIAGTQAGAALLAIGGAALAVALTAKGVQALGGALRGLGGETTSVESKLIALDAQFAATGAAARAAAGVVAASTAELDAASAGGLAAGAGAASKASGAVEEAGAAASKSSGLLSKLSGVTKTAGNAFLLSLVPGIGEFLAVGAVAVPIGVALGNAIADAGKKAQGTSANIFAAAVSAQRLQDAADAVGFPLDALKNALGDTGLAALELSVRAGSFTGDVAGALVKALLASGDSADQAKIALEQMGVSVKDANAAVDGTDTSGANAQLRAYAEQLYAAASAAAALANGQAQIAFSQSHGGELGPITFNEGAPRPPTPVPNFSVTPTKGGGSGSNFTGSGTGAGTSAAASAAKAAAKALADATATFKASLKDFTTAIGGAQTVAASNAAFDSLRAAITAEDKALGKAEPKGLASLVTKYQAEINSLERSIESINAQLAAAASATAQSISDTRSFGGLADIFSSISTAATTTTEDLSRLTLVLPGTVHALQASAPAQSAAQSFQAALDARVKTEQDFVANVNKLRSEGLDAGTLSDLINGGASANGAAAAQLAGETQAQIDAINKSEKALTDAGKALGSSAGDAAASAAADVGQQVVAGLVTGLQAKDSALEAAAKALGTTISDTIKKELKIKSPSLVTHQLGVHTGEGLRLGLLSTHSAIGDAASRLASAARPGIDIGAPDMALRGLGGAAGLTQGHVDQLAAAFAARSPEREIHAPVTIHNSGPADRTGEQVAGAIGRLIVR